MANKYRKKPVVIEAVQWKGNNEIEVMDFVGQRLKFSSPPYGFEHDNDITHDMVTIKIPTREGEQVADRYDYIIKGYTKGFGFHCWVCKPDYFKEAYELLEDQKIDWLSLYEINDSIKDKNLTAER